MLNIGSSADGEWRVLSTVEGLALLGGFGSFRLRERATSGRVLRGPLSGRREFAEDIAMTTTASSTCCLGDCAAL